jgi:hypothetical protein
VRRQGGGGGVWGGSIAALEDKDNGLACRTTRKPGSRHVEEGVGGWEGGG